MNDTRRHILELTKQELAKKPFIDGKRSTYIGLMSAMFDLKDEKGTEEGLVELAGDLHEFGLELTNVGDRPHMLMAVEREPYIGED